MISFYFSLEFYKYEILDGDDNRCFSYFCTDLRDRVLGKFDHEKNEEEGFRHGGKRCRGTFLFILFLTFLIINIQYVS